MINLWYCKIKLDLHNWQFFGIYSSQLNFTKVELKFFNLHKLDGSNSSYKVGVFA